MNKDLARSCLHQVTLWQSLLEQGEVTHSLFNTAEYKAALSFLNERLENEIKGHVENSAQGEEIFLHLIVEANSASAKEGLSELRKWLNGAKKIIICDPYFLQFQPSKFYGSIEVYANEMEKIIPSSVSDIDIFSNSYRSLVRKSVFKRLKLGRKVRHFSSHEIHDRFVIKDGKEGKLIGTSFGGFGRKFFAMVDLPPSDVHKVVSQLRELCPKPVGSRL
jgi:hypothetical protein